MTKNMNNCHVEIKAGISILKFVFIFTVLQINQQVMANEISFSSLYGTNSNPHKLADLHQPTGDEFLYADIKFSSKLNQYFNLKASAQSAVYTNDDNADWSKVKLDLQFKSKIKATGFKYKVSMDYLLNDRTYISKETGIVASLGGQSIGDRYDFNIVNLNGLLTYKTTQKISLALRFQRRNKSYETYNIANLSKLDYSHNLLGFNLAYPLANKAKIFVESSYTYRVYDDRRAKDLTGLNIEGTDLTYNLPSIKMGYSHNPNSNSFWKYTIKISKRTDNEAGYWDSNSNNFTLYTRQNLADKHSLRATLKYSSFDYDNQVDSISAELEDITKERKGYSLSLDYRWLLMEKKNSELSLYSKLELDSFDSSTATYKYDRNSFSVGIRWEF